jgi:hypothetical protein
MLATKGAVVSYIHAAAVQSLTFVSIRANFNLQEVRHISECRTIDTDIFSFTLQVVKLEQRTLSAIRFIKNAHSPINRLNPESLFLVFDTLATICFQAHKPYKWMVVKRVCRYWRNVALSFLSLWSIVDSDYFPQAYLSLERSKSAPISVYLRENSTRRFIEAVLSHINRIRELDISLEEHADWPLCSQFMEGIAPVLRHLP